MPETFYDDFKGRPAAKSHKMGIINDMDWVYDLKLLDDEDEIPSKYRNGAKKYWAHDCRTTRRLG